MKRNRAYFAELARFTCNVTIAEHRIQSDLVVHCKLSFDRFLDFFKSLHGNFEDPD